MQCFTSNQKWRTVRCNVFFCLIHQMDLLLLTYHMPQYIPRWTVKDCSLQRAGNYTNCSISWHLPKTVLFFLWWKFNMVKKAEKVLGTLSKLYKLYSFSFYKQLFYYRPTLLKLSLLSLTTKYILLTDLLVSINVPASFPTWWFFLRSALQMTCFRLLCVFIKIWQSTAQSKPNSRTGSVCYC